MADVVVVDNDDRYNKRRANSVRHVSDGGGQEQTKLSVASSPLSLGSNRV